MKKRMLRSVLSCAMAASMVLGCGVIAQAEETEAGADAVTTVGPEDGTHFELWSFVDAHNEFYGKMVELWNEQNPDRQLNVTFST